MSEKRAELSGRERRSYFAVIIVMPLLGAPLAVNGGPVFQILAIENLGLDAEQVGLAVGLGAVSIPFQILAARIPLRAAHRNLRLHVWLMAAMCLILAWLIPGPISTRNVIAAVIAIAVLAELSISVLFATSFQPLLSTTTGSAFRQRLNAQGRAIGGLAAIALVGLVSWSNSTWRIVILIVLATLGAMLAPAVSSLRRPEMEEQTSLAPAYPDSESATQAGEAGEGDGLIWVYVAIGVSLIPAWPFVVTYASAAYWPSANLGAVGAALTVGMLGASATWRPTDRLAARAQVGAIVTLFCALVLVVLDPARGDWPQGAIVLVVITIASGAGAVTRMALLELAHRRSSSDTTVAILTRFDVVASTSMQVGFLAGGYLIDSSIDSDWIVDPFQLSLIVGGVLLIGALVALNAESSESPGYAPGRAL